MLGRLLMRRRWESVMAPGRAPLVKFRSSRLRRKADHGNVELPAGLFRAGYLRSRGSDAVGLAGILTRDNPQFIRRFRSDGMIRSYHPKNRTAIRLIINSVPPDPLVELSTRRLRRPSTKKPR